MTLTMKQQAANVKRINCLLFLSHINFLQKIYIL